MSRTHTSPSSSRHLMLAIAFMAVVTGFGMAASLERPDDAVEPAATPAYLVRKPVEIPWMVFDEADVMSGVTIPADTHVVFHLPLLDFESIHREVLLGQKGDFTRYWGYCFPENYDPMAVESQRNSRFQGKLFLSELERAERQARLERERRNDNFSINDIPTKEEVLQRQRRPFQVIRHQMDIFRPGHLCYIMTEAPLPLGLDTDNDRLNNKLETEVGTDVSIADSDADGLFDGTEHVGRTDPLVRDSDTDGLIDGIEDPNWNGRTDPGESDPRNRDSDRDGLCDGLCRVRLANKQEVYIGEDINLNGILDTSESSPLLIDTDGDGIFDEHELLTCLLNGGNTRECRPI